MKALLSLVALASLTAAPQKATVVELLKDGKKFDQKTVVVVGVMDKFEQRTSKAGHAYFVFRLKDKTKWVNVYGKGTFQPPVKPPVINGDKVEVNGKFRVEKKVGDRTFRNEIEVDAKSGVKPVK
jgi:DNA polymerase III alpha subunit